MDNQITNNPDTTEFSVIKQSIAHKVQLLVDIREKLRPVNESMKSMVEGDSDVKMASELLKSYKDKLSMATNRIKNTPSYASLNQQKKDLGAEFRELKGSLDNFLLELYRLTGTKVFETLDGQTVEYVMKAVLRQQRGLKGSSIAKGQLPLT